MEANQRTSGALLSLSWHVIAQYVLASDQCIDRALADVSQLVRRFENILGHAPVSALCLNF